MKRALFLSAVVLLLAATVPVTAQHGLGRFAGYVVDEGGAPVSGVAVRATLDDGGAVQTTSNDKGEWAVAGVSKGAWHVVFTKGGFAPIAAKVTLEAELSRVPPIKITLKKN